MAIDRGGEEVIAIPIPENWKFLSSDSCEQKAALPNFIENIMMPMNALKGDGLPVSFFFENPDGTFPQGTAAYEKRGIAINVPEWLHDNCIQCNQCSYICPHAAIRPFLINDEEKNRMPSGMTTISAKGKGLDGLEFRIQLSPLDCMGCGNCADICPSKEKALIMRPLKSQLSQAELWDYMSKMITYKDMLLAKSTVKGSQFAKPLFEFSGACAGCGETPYIKLLTQLFGDTMMIANATGCTSIYCGSAPSTPFCKNSEGRGPSWASSLFEDNAEYGYGMRLGASHLRLKALSRIGDLFVNNSIPSSIRIPAEECNKNIKNGKSSRLSIMQLSRALESWDDPRAKELLPLLRYVEKRSIWIIGGDGWAYDIGFGGLDHVLASGDDVNLLVLDTEVYSNTGGQSSKSTPTSAVAKFAASGKKTRKKDLGLMAMSYGYVYVAQIAMGANHSQCLKAIAEAEAYPGPSLIIAYSSCINHGIKAGMGSSQKEMERAVKCGYWQLFRYNPRLEQEGKNPFILDSREPDWSAFRPFLESETRFSSLVLEFPDIADELFSTAEEDARKRYQRYRKLASDSRISHFLSE